MNSDEIYDLVELIAATPGTKDKINLVKEIDSEDFESVLRLAYDPYITFGIRRIIPEEPGTCEWDDWTHKLLSMLQGRIITGNEAVMEVEKELMRLSEESGDLLARVLKKDLRMGMDAKNINKAVPGLIPRVAYMRCSLPKHIGIESMEWEKGVISQEKANGLFANLTLGLENSFMTRKGMYFVNPSEFSGLFEQAADYLKPFHQYHGELLVSRDGKILSRKEGNGILNSVRLGGVFKSGEKPIYKVWDYVPLQALADGRYERAYEERLSDLEYMTKYSEDIQSIDSKWVFSYEEARAHYDELRAVVENGVRKEGTVCKKRSAVWLDGTSTEQIKLKGEQDCELLVIGFNPGKGKYEGQVGSLICVTEDRLLTVCVNLRSDEQRASVDYKWLGHIVQVVYCDLIQDKKGKYSLDLPRLSEEEPIRWDKDTADTLEYLKEKEVQ
jgi:DNA ligase-1